MIECIKQIAITKRFLPVIVQNRDYEELNNERYEI
tara:strand:- start:298 stop:402 length:105 start_codon:yes stop_codon:yes gene_type:complete